MVLQQPTKIHNNYNEYGLTSDYEGYYAISNSNELFWFAGLVNGTLGYGTNQNTSANAVLLNNIIVNNVVFEYDENMNLKTDTTNLRSWEPIGNNVNSRYNGIFDGNNKIITGLYYNNNQSTMIGFIGLTNESFKVMNLSIINSYFSAKHYIGGIVGTNKGGIIENCYNEVVIVGSGYEIGGIAGGNYEGGKIINCYNRGKIIGANQSVGGIVGFNEGTINNCYNLGIVAGDTFWVGGIVGYNVNNVMNCFNLGSVSGNSQVGGIVGENNNGLVTNCYYLDGTAIGGIAGVDIENQVEVKTFTQFKSGEITYLLNNNISDENVAFKQNIGDYNYPMFEGKVVYYGYEKCTSTIKTYSNDIRYQTIDELHDYENWKIKYSPTLENSGALIKECEYDSTHIVIFELPILNKTDYNYEERESLGKYTYIKDGQTFVFDIELPQTGSDGLKIAEIIAIFSGALLLLIIICFFIWWFMFKDKKMKSID